MKILVVDDEISIGLVTKDFLSSLGYGVDVANSGLEALALLDVNQYDLMLTDIEMPEMDGWKLIKEVNGRAEGRKMAIIVMSGSLADNQTRRIHVLSKPFSLATLNQAVLAALKSINRAGETE